MYLYFSYSCINALFSHVFIYVFFFFSQTSSTSPGGRRLDSLLALHVFPLISMGGMNPLRSLIDPLQPVNQNAQINQTGVNSLPVVLPLPLPLPPRVANTAREAISTHTLVNQQRPSGYAFT